MDQYCLFIGLLRKAEATWAPFSLCLHLMPEEGVRTYRTCTALQNGFTTPREMTVSVPAMQQSFLGPYSMAQECQRPVEIE